MCVSIVCVVPYTLIQYILLFYSAYCFFSFFSDLTLLWKRYNVNVTISMLEFIVVVILKLQYVLFTKLPWPGYYLTSYQVIL